jgi:hypothetical protein
MSTATLTPASALADRVHFISVSSTMKVAAEADRLRREGVDVVDFSVGEPDFPTPDNIKKAAIAAIENNFTKYTPAGGTVELKQAIIERHKTDYGTDYKMNEVIAGVGGKHEIFNLMQVLVNPGDEVIVPVPYWVTFKDVVNYAGGKCVFVDTDEDSGFMLTADILKPHITPKTKALILNSPSNPSGAVVPRAELEKIYQLAKAEGFFIITDECYCRFLYEGRAVFTCLPAGRKGHGDCGRLSVEDLCLHRLANRLCTGSGADHFGDQQSAKPLHLQPDVHRAEGRCRSSARSAGFHHYDDGGIHPPPRVCHQPPSEDGRVESTGAERSLLRLPEHWRGTGRQGEDSAGVCGEAAG